MFAAFLTTLLFSLSAVCANRTAQLLGGITANFWRLLLAGFLLAAWAHGFGQGFDGKALPVFVLSGCVGFGLGDLALFQALPRLGSRLTVLLVQCLAAPLAALIEWLWLGTALTVPQILCSAAILTGVGLALSPTGQAPSDEPERHRIRWWAGILFGLLAAFGQGFGAVLSRKAYAVASLAGQDIDGITAAYQRVLGGLVVGGLFLFWARAPATGMNVRDRWRKAWRWVVFNGLAGPTLGVSCYQWALKTIPTGVVLPIVAITPLVVIPFAAVFEGDRPGVRALVGGVLAVLGAIALTLAS